MTLMPIAEYAKSIGKSYYAVYIWITRHGLPCVQVGSRRYLDPDVCAEWLKSKVVVVEPRQTKAQQAMEEIKDIAPVSTRRSVRDKMARIY